MKLSVKWIAVEMIDAATTPRTTLTDGAFTVSPSDPDPRLHENRVTVYLPETVDVKLAPGLNAGAFVAATLISSPGRGLRAVRALRARRSNVPKPGNVTFSPFFTCDWIVSTNALTTS